MLEEYLKKAAKEKQKEIFSSIQIGMKMNLTMSDVVLKHNES